MCTALDPARSVYRDRLSAAGLIRRHDPAGLENLPVELVHRQCLVVDRRVLRPVDSGMGVDVVESHLMMTAI